MPASPLVIRPAEARDRAALWSILEPMVRAGDTYTIPSDFSEAETLAYWLGPDRETFIAERDGEALGTYYLRANQPGGGAHVCNCGYVTGAAARGQGVARAMCAHSLDLARARGYRAMQFNFVVSTNEGAIRLWERMGFETVGRLPGAFAHPRLGDVDALVMYRTL
ncbi:GNAT family N-acetyltransferase [Amaricoccus solimangrovi]|uniref:GNAT family N-acetyltransferase n=1 Tax=Amaricoccus solimangrovi TaxID=2589815 RepID=A0A501WTX4_9RHOB|nr:GNAT family N-acetyltransferase [Amaricoccus solimangrovi]TPE50411.1 GNAT family N-acetyltransferase [Amaricoccus solimangrovi]